MARAPHRVTEGAIPLVIHHRGNATLRKQNGPTGDRSHSSLAFRTNGERKRKPMPRVFFGRCCAGGESSAASANTGAAAPPRGVAASASGGVAASTSGAVAVFTAGSKLAAGSDATPGSDVGAGGASVPSGGYSECLRGGILM